LTDICRRFVGGTVTAGMSYRTAHEGLSMDEAVVGKLATVLALTVGMLVATWIIVRLDFKHSID
jgi:hypothetical protein